MKWPRCFLVNSLIFRLGLIIFLFVIFSGNILAVEKQPADKLLAANYSMVGLRLGFWADMANANVVPDISVDADLPDAGFYTEIFLDYRLARPLMIELSMGVASRGDVVIIDADDKYVGTINLYPLLLQLKLSPLSGRTHSFHPFLLAGGGFVWGRQSIEFVSSVDFFYNPDIATKTETDFIGVVGGGFDLALSEQLGLSIVTKYHPVKFGDSLGGVSEYSGIAFSIGVSYFLHRK
jgi:hypothetical protein